MMSLIRAFIVITSAYTGHKVTSSYVIRTLDFSLLLSYFLRYYYTKLNIDSYN